MDFLCLDFVNSRWEREHKTFAEPLEEREWVLSFCGKWDLPVADFSEEAMESLQDLRSFLYRTLCGFCSEKNISPSVLTEINGHLSSISFHRELKAENGVFQLQLTPQDRGASRSVFRIVSSLADLLSQHPPERIKLCGNPDCGWIFLDESKNHTRKWCGNTCATLIKVRRFRANRKRMLPAADALIDDAL